MGFQGWCDSLRRRRLISSARQQQYREEKSVGAPTDGASSVILRLSGANPEWLGMGEVRWGRSLGPLPIPQATFHWSNFSSKGLLQVQLHPHVRHCCQKSQPLPRPGRMIYIHHITYLVSESVFEGKCCNIHPLLIRTYIYSWKGRMHGVSHSVVRHSFPRSPFCLSLNLWQKIIFLLFKPYASIHPILSVVICTYI